MILESIINTLFLISITSFSLLIGFYLNLIKRIKIKFYKKFYDLTQFFIFINILLFFIPKYILMIITDNIYLTFILYLLPYTYFIFHTSDHYNDLIQYFKLNYSYLDKLYFFWRVFKPQILFSLFIISAEVISDFTVTNFFSYTTLTLKIFLDYQNYLNPFYIWGQILILLSIIFFVLKQVNLKPEMDQKLILSSYYFIEKINLKNSLIFLPFIFILSYLIFFDFKFISFCWYLLQNIWYQIFHESDQILIQIRIFWNSIFFASLLAILIISLSFLKIKNKTIFYFFYFIPNIIFALTGMYLHLGVFTLIFLIFKYLNLALIIDYFPKINSSFWIEIRQLSSLNLIKFKGFKYLFIIKNLFNHYKSILTYVFILIFNEIIKEVPITMFSLSDKINLMSFEIYNYINNEVYEKVSLLILLLVLISIVTGSFLKIKKI